MKKIIGIILLALVAGLLNLSQAKAIGLRPAIFEIKAEPGEQLTRMIDVVNNKQNIRNYRVNVYNFKPSGEEGAQDYLTEDSDYGLATWINVQPEEFSLEPGEINQVAVVISVPADAEPGGHYAAVFFTRMADDREKVSLGSNTGSVFLVEVSGEIDKRARVAGFNPKDRKNFNRLPVPFEYRVENNGNTHFRPEGNIVIKDMFGRQKADFGANPWQSRSLPQSTRRIETVWQKNDRQIKGGGFWQELKNEWQNFAVGYYKAELNVSFDGQPLAGDLKTGFWVIPWRVLLVAVLIIICLVCGIRQYNKFLIRRSEKKK